MLKNQTKPLRLEIKKSIVLQWFIILMHGFALFACIANALPLWIRIILLAAVSLHAGVMWWRYIQQHYDFKLLYSQNRGWELEDKFGTHEIQIMASTLVALYAIVLHYKFQSGKKQSIFILKDSLLTEQYRELTVALKLYGSN